MKVDEILKIIDGNVKRMDEIFGRLDVIETKLKIKPPKKRDKDGN